MALDLAAGVIAGLWDWLAEGASTVAGAPETGEAIPKKKRVEINKTV